MYVKQGSALFISRGFLYCLRKLSEIKERKDNRMIRCNYSTVVVYVGYENSLLHLVQTFQLAVSTAFDHGACSRSSTILLASMKLLTAL